MPQSPAPPRWVAGTTGVRGGGGRDRSVLERRLCTVEIHRAALRAAQVEMWKQKQSQSQHPQNRPSSAAAPSRGGGQNQYSARQPSCCTCQGRSWRAMTSVMLSPLIDAIWALDRSADVSGLMSLAVPSA